MINIYLKLFINLSNYICVCIYGDGEREGEGGREGEREGEEERKRERERY